ncbi:hypothetical protein BDZ89DRAFT_1121225 [Hymenopellis radicata]|nr:hypothetical protein BDZ89DRAFT_1121225 [Hymenopellis radicata]
MSRIPQLLLCPARCVLVFFLLGSVSYCFTPVLYSRRPPVCIRILILVPLTLRTSIILAAAAVAVGFLATVSPDRFIRLGRFSGYGLEERLSPTLFGTAVQAPETCNRTFWNHLGADYVPDGPRRPDCPIHMLLDAEPQVARRTGRMRSETLPGTGDAVVCYEIECEERGQAVSATSRLSNKVVNQYIVPTTFNFMRKAIIPLFDAGPQGPGLWGGNPYLSENIYGM